MLEPGAEIFAFTFGCVRTSRAFPVPSLGGNHQITPPPGSKGYPQANSDVRVGFEQATDTKVLFTVVSDRRNLPVSRHRRKGLRWRTS